MVSRKSWVAPVTPAQPLGPEDIQIKRDQAEQSQNRLYPGDWVWEFIEGDGIEFDYGYDFIECGTQKFYHEKGADVSMNSLFTLQKSLF